MDFIDFIIIIKFIGRDVYFVFIVVFINYCYFSDL